jgi:hypothetical protein
MNNFEFSDICNSVLKIYFVNNDFFKAKELLISLGINELPLLDISNIDRIRLAIIKFSNGNIDELINAIKLAKNDWRDLLVATDFAENSKSHMLWAESILKV